MKNPHSSDGIAEDMIRSFVQIGCAELHTKTLIEKATAELENGIIDTEDEKAVEYQVFKINSLSEELEEQARLRRMVMVKLYEMYDGDKDYWCEVKHLGLASYTLFEAYQASDRDEELYQLALEVNNQFIKALSHFLGIEITECAACFADLLKAKGELNGN